MLNKWPDGRKDNDEMTIVAKEAVTFMSSSLFMYCIVFQERETACVYCVRVIPMVSVQYTDVYIPV